MTSEPTSQSSEPPSREPAAWPTGTRVIDSEQLFAGERTVVIRHAGEYYRLQITRNDKLILQK